MKDAPALEIKGRWTSDERNALKRERAECPQELLGWQLTSYT